MASPGVAPASWKSLPKKSQLAILTLSRVADFIQITSFQAVCYYQLKSFNTAEGETTLSWQTGVALASFTASQSCTAILWGYVADARWGGRKTVLLAGLLGTGVSCLGLAVATSFQWVVTFRMLAGALNGTVGAVRTMMAEVIGSPRHQARAFLLLPLSLSIATVVGPGLAGWLSKPSITSQSVWLQSHPYALPALASGLFLLLTSAVVMIGLHETLKGLDHRLSIAQRFKGYYLTFLAQARGNAIASQYEPVAHEERHITSEFNTDKQETPRPKMPFSRVLTPNVVLTFLTHSFLEFHLGAFDSLWPLLLSGTKDESSTLGLTHGRFRGGLGMQPDQIGSAMATMGMTSLALQLLLYPKIHVRFGPLKCYRAFSLLFPVAYFLSPFLVTIPQNHSGEPGAYTWIAVWIILLIHSTGRIFCIPALITLLNNCSPHPSALGTINGVAQTISSLFRTIGPACAGYCKPPPKYSAVTVNDLIPHLLIVSGIGHTKGVIGISWWSIAGLALVGWVTSLLVVEGVGNIKENMTEQSVEV